MKKYIKELTLVRDDNEGQHFTAHIVFQNIPATMMIIRADNSNNNEWWFDGDAVLEFVLVPCDGGTVCGSGARTFLIHLQKPYHQYGPSPRTHQTEIIVNRGMQDEDEISISTDDAVKDIV